MSLVIPLQLKRSSTPGAVPTGAQLIAGELAVNFSDGKLFFERVDGAILQIPGFPTDLSNMGSAYSLDFGSLDDPANATVITFTNSASVGVDFGVLP